MMVAVIAIMVAVVITMMTIIAVIALIWRMVVTTLAALLAGWLASWLATVALRCVTKSVARTPLCLRMQQNAYNLPRLRRGLLLMYFILNRAGV